MGDTKDIIADLNLPKQILDKGEALLKILFGPSFKELGENLADQVRARRFKNQLAIFEKAQKQLAAKGINPKKVSLKVLAPLIEFCSYEEDENLQTKWSNLVTHVLSTDEDTLLFQNCISILNKISNDEALLTDYLYQKVDLKRHKKHNEAMLRYDVQIKNNPKFPKPKDPPEFDLEMWGFDIGNLAREQNVDLSTLTYRITNLITLGLLKWETEVEVSVSEAKNIDLDVDVYNNNYFIFTPLGIKFVELCKHE